MYASSAYRMLYELLAVCTTLYVTFATGTQRFVTPPHKTMNVLVIPSLRYTASS